MQNTERQDIYTRITGKIVASLETGVRPWIKPWSGENAAGTDHAPAAPQRHALFRHQHPDAVGVGHRTGLRLTELDDLQAGA